MKSLENVLTVFCIPSICSVQNSQNIRFIDPQRYIYFNFSQYLVKCYSHCVKYWLNMNVYQHGKWSKNTLKEKMLFTAIIAKNCHCNTWLKAIKRYLRAVLLLKYATSYGNEIRGALSRLSNVYKKRFVQLFANEITMRGSITQEWWKFSSCRTYHICLVSFQTSDIL